MTALPLDRPEWRSLWTPLLEAAVVPATAYQYTLGVRHFLVWIASEYPFPLRTAPETDEAVAEYGQWVYANHGGRGRWQLVMADSRPRGAGGTAGRRAGRPRPHP